MEFQYQLLPSLSAEEYADLKASIAERGVQVPVEFDEKGNVLDGHHRLQACAELGIKDYPSIVRAGMTEEQKNEHVLDLNLNRRHLSPVQRTNLEAKLRGMGYSYRKIAKMVKVDPMTVHNDLKSGVENSTPAAVTGTDGKKYPARSPKPDKKPRQPSVFTTTESERKQVAKSLAAIPAEELPATTMNPKQLKGYAIDYQKQKTRETLAEEKPVLPGDIQVVTADFRDALAQMDANSVDLIFTDPPYDAETVPLYGDLAIAAHRVLKPGGSLIAYAGHYALPEILDLMTPHLRFWWLLAVKHSGNNARLIGKNVFVGWKPMVWFVKERRRDNEFISDIVQSSQPDKDAHDWQQDTTESDYYIDHLTQPGDVVLDPFCGSGTTLISAYKLGRKAIGIELDKERANVARTRIQTVCR